MHDSRAEFLRNDDHQVRATIGLAGGCARVANFKKSRSGAQVFGCVLPPSIVLAGLPSKHRQPVVTLTTREGSINPRDLGLRQLYIGRAGILFDMLDAGRFGGRED